MKTIPLYCDLEYRSNLGSWLNEHELTGAGAEIGVLAGSFSREVLHQWKGYRYFMVDPWVGQSKDVYRERNDERNYESLYEECRKIAQGDERVRIIRKMSADAALDVEDASLDWVYIDANHAYGPVLTDLDSWWPKLRVGGVMGLHDYGNDTNWPNWVEVKRAVDRWCSEHQIVFVYSRCNSVWMIKRS